MKAEESFKLLNLKKKLPITQDQIKAAYKSQAKILHPDNKETGDEDMFKKLGEAFDFLRNNIDKINEVNLKEKQKKNDDFYLFKGVEAFIESYQKSTNDNKKQLIYDFADYIDKMKQKDTEYYLKYLMKKKMQGYY